jgi:hypothetical protein
LLPKQYSFSTVRTKTWPSATGMEARLCVGAAAAFEFGLVDDLELVAGALTTQTSPASFMQ